MPSLTNPVQVDVPILGICENMSWFVCGNCGHESHPFGSGEPIGRWALGPGCGAGVACVTMRRAAHSVQRACEAASDSSAAPHRPCSLGVGGAEKAAADMGMEVLGKVGLGS